jgi:hypothetical protein
MFKNKKKLPEGMIAIREEDLGTLLLCSMRYSIGRHTYMPSEICRIINTHKDELSNVNKELLAKDIMSELRHMEVFKNKNPDSTNTRIKQEEEVKWVKLVNDLCFDKLRE